MARKEEFKAVQIPADLHARVAKLVKGTDMSITKVITMMLASSITDIEESGSFAFQVSKNKDGILEYRIVAR